MIPENTLNEEAKNELNEIKEIEKSLYYEYTYNFQNFCTINTLVETFMIVQIL